MTGRFSVPGAGAYMDVLGRRWDVPILGGMLNDPVVLDQVQAVYRDAHEGRRFVPALCHGLARQMYVREEAAALLHLLVAFYCSSIGKPWPGGSRAPR